MTPLTSYCAGRPAGCHRPVSGIGLPALIAGLLLSACGETGQTAAPNPQTVQVVDVIQKDVPIQQEWIGTLDGMINAQILAQVSGYLIKQNYQEGQLVQKGQLLYEIDPKVLQAALDRELGNLARQEAIQKTEKLDLERIARLLPEKAVSVRDRDNAEGSYASAQAQVQSAKAAVESARLQLGFARITSPITGIAGISKAQLGNLVGPGAAAELTTVSQLDPIKAYIPLSEQQYLQFARHAQTAEASHDGLPLELILADDSTYPHPGKFYFADRQVNIKTGTIQVAILFPNPDNLLRPGQYAKIRAVIRYRRNALLVPQRAVGDMQGKRQVAVVNSDNTVAIREVKVAETIGTEWVIEEGLQPGERVVVEGIQKIRSGSKVNPTPYVATSSITKG
ncbi:MAG: efflux RND transporter periplasmic adaptor subunit [Methylococcales bacterium]|nr:efflux RND transporter periplasmic adaptor subunit [Methylococcales bacterium]